MNAPLSNPWLAAWCIWPVGLTLICIAWQFTELVTRGMNLMLAISTLASNTFVLTVRGYAPQSAEAAALRGDGEEDKGAGGES